MRSVVMAILACLIAAPSFAHDHRIATSPEMKKWFDKLHSKRGPCCSDADGTALSDVDWQSNDGKYTVRIDGVWHDVPDDAVLKVPNIFGLTMVWPIYMRDSLGHSTTIMIRCFIPGVMG